MFLAKTQQQKSRQKKGQWAEDKVEYYLRRRGWRIVARNYHAGHGELDIVASRWKTLLVAEVRYRKDGNAQLSINQEKLLHLRSAAQSMIHQHKLQQYTLRYDIFALDSSGKITRFCDIKD